MAYTQAQLTDALVNLLKTDPNAAYNDIVKAASTYGITPEQVQATFGTLPAGNDRTAVPQYTQAQTTNINNAINSSDPVAQAWGRAEQTGDYGDIANLIKNIPAPTLLSKYGLTNQDISYIYSRPTVTDPLSTAWINAEKTKQTGTTPITGTPPTQTATVGQFRELFPSFEESKRLAGQMVANRPTTEQVVNMIAKPQNPNLISAWQNAEQSGNYGDVANMIKGVPMGTLQSTYGLSNADMQYIMSRPEIASSLQNTTTAAPSLNNVLSMISK